jgi:hypothetical protein
VQSQISVGHREAEDWQMTVERLLGWVCLLLTKNQILRDALEAE